jgi:hypothetical protein
MFGPASRYYAAVISRGLRHDVGYVRCFKGEECGFVTWVTVCVLLGILSIAVVLAELAEA